MMHKQSSKDRNDGWQLERQLNTRAHQKHRQSLGFRVDQSQITLQKYFDILDFLIRRMRFDHRDHTQ